MYWWYAHLLVGQLEYDWDAAAGTTRDQHAAVLKWNQDFFLKESWFDERFARGRQDDVPRALKTMARRELPLQGLNGYEPVLTVGPPEVFETHKRDLASFLLGSFIGNLPTEVVDLSSTAKLAVISVPYIEGTRALWTPIPIGHEIAHLRIELDRVFVLSIETGRAQTRHLDTAAWIDEIDSELQSLIAAERRPGAPPSGLGVLQKSRQTLQSWVDEVLCDLNAVRLFGPAALSAIAEFVLVVGRTEKGAETPTSSHPPLSARVAAMLEFLTAIGEVAVPTHFAPWLEYIAAPKSPPDERLSVLLGILRGHLPEIIEHALGWGEVYRASTRFTEVEWVAGELLDGIPGGTHCLKEPRVGSEIRHEDVVEAAWGARERLDTPGVETDSQPLLLRSDFTKEERRIRLDDLASKAIDSVELATLWRIPGREVVNLGSPALTEIEPDVIVSGLLSKKQLDRRLRASGRDRVVITPLLVGSIQSAGVDVRLSPNFIVFRHSATSAFDPVGRTQDPRTMQESVGKSWGEPFVLHPGELVLASTLEYVVLPLDLAAQVVTRSSYGRLGLITATAVQVQPGSHGCITLELVNHSETPIALVPGSRVAQLVFFKVGEPETRLDPGKYWFPTGPQFSRVQTDEDADALRHLGEIAMPGAHVTDAPVQPGTAASLSFTGSMLTASRLHAIALLEGMDVYVQPIALAGEPGVAASERLCMGEQVAAYLVAGAGALATVTAVIITLVRNFSKGRVISIDEEGNLTVSSPPGLPRGVLVIVQPDGTEVRLPSSERTATAELSDLLANAIPRHGRSQ